MKFALPGVVYVHMQGACHGCPMSQITLKKGIERLVKERVPEVISVESV
jgi:Fe-S cluster biogenesis protein NfuA